MIDSKIKIYVKFRVWKRCRNFRGAKLLPPFLGSRALILASFSPEAPSKGPQISARRTFFQKRSRTIVVLRWMISSPGRNNVSSQKRRCPTKKTPKVPFLPNSGCFSEKAVRHCRFWEESSFLSKYPIVQRRTTIVSESFRKNVRRAEIWVRF